MTMRGLVLDTSAYSQFRRGEPQTVELLERVPRIWLPSVVIGELLAGFVVGSRERENRATLRQFIAEPFVSGLDADSGVAEHYAEVFADLRAAGTPIPTNDLWIAASARSVGAPLLTFDAHFARVQSIDAVILSPA